MKSISARLSFALALLIFVPISSFGHCEIPCGIYGDETRFELLTEHIGTIEKSMHQINELAAAGDKNNNQLVRWINNKEAHADKYAEIVTQYFMAQRVKPVDQGDEAQYAVYTNKVTLLHQMLVAAMKCKQTTDTAHTEKLRQLLAKFHDLYQSDRGN
ncbi:MAG: superoxide dismutase [bacterium]|nr:superoxide dismutase [bacterium]